MAEQAEMLPHPSIHMAWMDAAACRGRTTIFFPPHAERPQARIRREAKARSICAGCPALLECRAFARQRDEQGFWGGESQEERAEAASWANLVQGRGRSSAGR